MSNASIVQMMREACDHWESGKIDSNELADELASLSRAIEGVKQDVSDQGNYLQCYIHAASEEEEPIKAIQGVISQVRRWLHTIPA